MPDPLQTISAQGNTVSGISLALPNPITVGSLIVVTGSAWGRSFNAGQCTDNRGQTYDLNRAGVNGSVNTCIYSLKNAQAGATTITLTATGPVDDISITIAEYAGMDTSSPFDVAAEGTGNSATHTSGTTAATAQADTLLVMVDSHDGSTGAVTATSPMTLREQQTSVVDMVIAFADRTVSAIGTYNGSFAWMAGNFDCLIAAFKIQTGPVTPAFDPNAFDPNAFEAGTGISGTLASALPMFTAAASATVATSATVSAALPILTVASSGTVRVTGALAAALPTVTLAGSGTVTNPPMPLVAALPMLAFAASGAVRVTGALAAALPMLGGASSASVQIAGTLAASVPMLTSAAAAVVPVTGTGGLVLPMLMATASGTVRVTGTASAALPIFTLASSGTVRVTGTLAAALPMLTAQLSQVLPPISGTIARALPIITMAASAAVPISGTVAAAMPVPAFAAVAPVALVGALAAAVPMFTGQGVGEIPIVGTLAVVMPTIHALLIGFAGFPVPLALAPRGVDLLAFATSVDVVPSAVSMAEERATTVDVLAFATDLDVNES